MGKNKSTADYSAKERNMTATNKTDFLIISGGVGTGKSSIADLLAKTAISNGLTVIENDHHLFAFRKSFEKDLAEVKARISNSQPDIGIIVIGTGDGQQLKIEFDGDYFPARKLFQLFLTPKGKAKD
jgi:ribose 5-phosphate isomerase RpiB